MTSDAISLAKEPKEFSLVSGGLFNALLMRCRLLREPVELLRERTLAFVAITWLPLLVLSFFEGNAWGVSVQLPFLYDVSTHARFLIAIPLLFLADRFAYQRMPPTVDQFRQRGIVGETDLPRLEAILNKGPQLTSSVIPELICLLAAYTLGHVIWTQAFSIGTTSWYGSTVDDLHATKAGLWYEWVSLPLFRFLFFRWFFRLGVWGYMLFKISRLRLQLLPSHPDRVGGLGFLNMVINIFSPIILAWGVLLSGQIAMKIISQHQGHARAMEIRDFMQFKFEGIGVLVIAMLFMLAPLLFFTPALLSGRRTGIREYGALGARYTREFDRKWIEGKAKDEPLVGSADIQSLADLANSYEVVKKMGVVVISRSAVIQLILALAVPSAPLLLTVIPLSDLLKHLVKFVL
jgi:hypothetical protein